MPMSTPRRSSTRVRREVFERCKWTDASTGRTMLTCHICGLPIDPAREPWEAEHVIRRALTNSDDPAGILPAHPTDCHSEKTRTDNRDNNKGRRVRDRHFNIKQSRGLRKPKDVKFDWGCGRYVRIDKGPNDR